LIKIHVEPFLVKYALSTFLKRKAGYLIMHSPIKEWLS
jgi:hypothetical protein